MLFRTKFLDGVMYMKKINFYLTTVLILASLFILTSCTPPQQMSFENINIGHGFSANVQPAKMDELTSPSYGFYTRQKDSKIEFIAFDVEPYKFLKWEFIKDDGSKMTELDENPHEIILTSDYSVYAFFGCANDEACKPGFVCDTDTNECVSP